MTAMLKLTVLLFLHGFVWSASEGMVDLAPLTGYASSDAFLVNNSGQVVGTSYTERETPLSSRGGSTLRRVGAGQ
ncbi:MAG TPA: hypothetical protein VFU28_15770 [Vicinamibacterales bacterium]|nr:hypothetical protein [Vicinamibacterales bacterium]